MIIVSKTFVKVEHDDSTNISEFERQRWFCGNARYFSLNVKNIFRARNSAFQTSIDSTFLVSENASELSCCVKLQTYLLWC